jgi:hypothetical protein
MIETSEQPTQSLQGFMELLAQLAARPVEQLAEFVASPSGQALTARLARFDEWRQEQLAQLAQFLSSPRVQALAAKLAQFSQSPALAELQGKLTAVPLAELQGKLAAVPTYYYAPRPQPAIVDAKRLGFTLTHDRDDE